MLQQLTQARLFINPTHTVKDHSHLLHVRHATLWTTLRFLFINLCLEGSSKSHNNIWIPVNCKKQKQTFPSRNTSRRARAAMGCTALSPSFHGNLLLWKLGRWRGKGRWGQEWEMRMKKRNRERVWQQKGCKVKEKGLLWDGQFISSLTAENLVLCRIHSTARTGGRGL